MKFEESDWELRCNEYWNKNVVTMDNTIRTSALGFSFLGDSTDVSMLINEYYDRVMNVVSNVERQAYMFEDKAYIQEYVQNSVSQAVEDLSFYYYAFPQYAKDCSLHISTLSKKLPSSEQENVPSLYAIK